MATYRTFHDNRKYLRTRIILPFPHFLDALPTILVEIVGEVTF